MTNIDILCISESRLSPHHNLRQINGYSIFRKDSRNTSERGVAIIVRDNLNVKIISCSHSSPTSSQNLEHLTIQVQYKKIKSFLICCVYRHPDYHNKILNDDYEELDNIFTNLISKNKNFYILGDFNLRDNHSFLPLLSLIEAKNLNQLIAEPTRGDKILDLIIVNNSNSILSTNVYNPQLSDHAYIECKIKFSKIKYDKVKILHRNLNNIDNQKLNSILDNMKEHMHSTSAVKMTDEFVTFIHNTMDKLAPVREKYVINYPIKKFISNETRCLIKKRDQCYNNARNSSELKQLKMEVKKSIIKDTSTQWEETVKKLNLWGCLKKLYPLVQPKTSLLNISPDDINKFFVDISTRSKTGGSLPPLPQRPNFPWHESVPNPNFKFKTLQLEDITKAWKATKNHTSTTSDTMGLSNKLIDICIKNFEFVKILLKLFNTYISTETIPSTLKISRVVAVPKVNNPQSPNDFRPIALQPTLAKIFGKCIFDQLVKYLETNSMLSPFQFGFRKGHSTTHALIALTDFLYENLDKGNVCILISLDISKAYDKTCRQVLLHKLKWYGIDSKLIESFLSDRSQFVETKCEGCCTRSSTLFTDIGIPQGLCLSCLLFLIIINDLPSHIKNSLCIMYADDTGVAASGPPNAINELVNIIENELFSIAQFMINNRLALNENKCNFMVFSKKRIDEEIKIRLNDHPLQRVQEMKLLGVLIDDKLLFNGYAKSIARKCNGALWSLSPLKFILSPATKTIIIRALVLSILNYASCIWIKACKSNQETVNRIIRACVRFIYCKNKYDSLCDIINIDLGLLLPDFMYQYEIAKLCFKFFSNSAPDYFNNYLATSVSTIRQTRRNAYTILKPSHSSKMGRKSFRFNAEKVWSQLPESIRNIINVISFPQFKKWSFNYFLDNQRTNRMYELFNLIDDYENDN